MSVIHVQRCRLHFTCRNSQIFCGCLAACDPFSGAIMRGSSACESPPHRPDHKLQYCVIGDQLALHYLCSFYGIYEQAMAKYWYVILEVCLC